MKKGHIKTGCIFLAAGFVLLLAALLWDTPLDSILIGIAGAGVGTGIAVIFDECRGGHRGEGAGTELDGGKQKEALRDKAGRLAYEGGLVFAAVSIIVFSVLEKLQIISWGLAAEIYLGIYILFQLAAGNLIYRYLRKKYSEK